MLLNQLTTSLFSLLCIFIGTEKLLFVVKVKFSHCVFPSQFDGEQGDYFQQQAAEFVRSQFTALENLKQQQKRDQRLSNFLQEQENNPACRRLQLKDMLPAGFQRLSKVSRNYLLQRSKQFLQPQFRLFYRFY